MIKQKIKLITHLNDQQDVIHEKILEIMRNTIPLTSEPIRKILNDVIFQPTRVHGHHPTVGEMTKSQLNHG